MVDMLMDREGDADLPPNYTLVANEVEFLRFAVEDQPLFVRGDKLCDWAEIFFIAREMPYRETHSVTRELQSICAELTKDNAQTLAQYLGSKLSALDRPITIQSLLQALYQSPIWRGHLSVNHAASWLLWIYQTNPDENIHPLLAMIGGEWQAEADHPLRGIYQVHTTAQTQQMLEDWLGIGDRKAVPVLDEFPLDIPEELQKKARSVWAKMIIESHGKYFDQLVKQSIPFALKKIAAQEACRYYLYNPDELSKTNLEQLSIYLTSKEIDQLRHSLAPDEPPDLPTDPTTVLKWFHDNYLPYREWQHRNSSEQSQGVVLQAARRFALWYLDQYPKALAGGSFRKLISFQRVNELSDSKDCLTLVVVLDGLHVTDARYLLQCIRTQTQRLNLVADDLVFTPLPTITQFAKEALFKGVPPDKTKDVGTVGEILPEDKSPATKLSQAHGKGLYLWRVLEPDRTYHQKNKSENLRQDVDGRLQAEAAKIKEIVESVPDSVVMQIVITTDHGRMLGKAVRTLSVPNNMLGHGRVAWGKSHKVFPESGYLIEEDLAYLFADSFGLPDDTVIPLDESAFLGSDDHSGSELYPHGGLFPEEVIIPWIVLARDSIRPDVELVVSGRGRARRGGTLQIHITNQSDEELVLEKLTIIYRPELEKTLDLNLAIGACSEKTHVFELESWPTPSDVKYARSIARLRQPNQMVFEYQATQTDIQSEDMYVAPDENILEDLL